MLVDVIINLNTSKNVFEIKYTLTVYTPINIPIKDVALIGNPIERGISGDKRMMRGMAMSVGSPPQEFAFMPEWLLNNTWLFGEQGFCDTSISEEACFTRRGGAFKGNRSSTFSTINNVATEDRVLYDNNTVKAESWGRDEFVLAPNVTLRAFPFGIAGSDWGGGYHTQMSVGMGANSTILTALKEAGEIGSRTWSMFWGLTGATPEAQMDGAFVFGGYDAAKIKGNNVTHDIRPSDRCRSGLVLPITDIQLNFPNGSSPYVFFSGTMNVCIQPDHPVLMTLPLDPYYNRFEELTQTTNIGRSSGINYWGHLYDPEDVFQGDMTFSFAFGPKIRISNSQLVIPDMMVNQSGYVVTNTSTREVVINSIKDFYAGDIPIIGRQFLSSAYIMVNQDENTFTLWEANPTKDINLVAVADDETMATRCRIADASSSPESTSTRAADSSNSDTGSTRLTPGILAAVFIVAVIAVGSLALVAFCLRRRSRRRKQAAMGLTPPEPQYSIKPAYDPGLQEIASSQPGHEMWAEHRGVVHEMEHRRVVHELS